MRPHLAVRLVQDGLRAADVAAIRVQKPGANLDTAKQTKETHPLYPPPARRRTEGGRDFLGVFTPDSALRLAPSGAIVRRPLRGLKRAALRGEISIGAARCPY